MLQMILNTIMNRFMNEYRGFRSVFKAVSISSVMLSGVEASQLS
jgi:hypothetical protein